MSLFKPSNKKLPDISTASLPDIVFLLLIFFMVSTRLRQNEVHVQSNPLPAIEEAQKLERRHLISYINIGPSTHPEKMGTQPRIQLNNQLAELKDIAGFVNTELQARPEAEREALTFALKVNSNTPMFFVENVKQELRKAGAIRICYSTTKERKPKKK